MRFANLNGEEVRGAALLSPCGVLNQLVHRPRLEVGVAAIAGVTDVRADFRVDAIVVVARRELHAFCNLFG